MTIQTDRAVLREGQLVRWDGDKGFGFIRPADGDRDVFLHVSALPQGQYPAIGNRIVFSSVDDAKGRGQRALKAVIQGSGAGAIQPVAVASRTESGPRRPRRRATEPPRTDTPDRCDRGHRARPRDQRLQALALDSGTFVVAGLTLLCLWGAVMALPHSPWPLLAYPVFSLSAFILYAQDKLRAIRGQWRIPESTLHLAEALGGWPGAYVAQRTMRHKTVKVSYQAIYWLIVTVHSAFWTLWIFLPEALAPMWELADSGKALLLGSLNA